ncbi:MAG: 2-oxo acid dehydrogenase subunit E2 [Actinomycetota bacterium]|nr:2-oxo acid dehydrogenase subunit E2 [Actinomycetota bacterium]
MPVSVTMPRLGESVTEGTVTRWLKNEGDHVDADEPLLEVSTDKVDTEVPSPASGTVLSIKVREDETVEIGVELAVIGDASQAPETEPEADQESSPTAEVQHEEPVPAPAAPQPSGVSESAGPGSEPTHAEPASVADPVTAPQASEDAPHERVDGAPERVDGAPERVENVAAANSAPARSGDDEDEVSGTYVTPLVRKLASEHGVDLSTVAGTGVGGRIRKSDVIAAADNTISASPTQAQTSSTASHAAATPAGSPTTAPQPSAQAPTSTTVSAGSAPVAASVASAPPDAGAVARGRVEPMSRMRQVIASRMVESLQTSAQLTTVVEVDVTKITRLRAQARHDFEAREGVKLTFLPFFAVAAIEALKAHPVVNASIDVQAKTITYHEAEHVGIAVDTERGLAVPVIHNAGDLNLGGIARKIADLAERTRENRVSPDELGGGTFTITNTGSRGALFDTPIINQPQVAILGTGAVVKRAVVVSDRELGETITARSMVYLALSYDHRIVDGADAARFLTTIKQRLEAGAFERALGLG